jgi:hypothetical protein
MVGCGMNYNMTKQKLDELNTQLRIMILQNVREEEEYDDCFLEKMNRIINQILELKKSLKKERIGLNRIDRQFTKAHNLHY